MQQQWQLQQCTETTDGNGEMAMEERQHNGGNWALVAVVDSVCIFIG